MRLAWISWLVICVVWGTTYVAIKIGLETIPPFLLGGLRYIAAGLILATALAARRHPLPARADWRTLAVTGFFMLGLGNGGVVWGAQFISSGLTAVLIGTTPFWMVTVEALLPGAERLSARQWAGLAVGFVGIAVLVWPDIAAGGTHGRDMILGVVGVQIACAGWAVGSAYTRRHVMPRDVFGAAAMQMIFGGLFMLAAATMTSEWGRLSVTTRTGAAAVYLTIAGSVVAYAAYSYALQYLSVAVVSLYTYINPVIAVALGAALLGETFSWRMAGAVAIIVAGVVITGRSSPSRRRASAP
jgi:drug/metabolite transporter (DMT)-like permease